MISTAVTERAPAQCRRRTCSENGVGRCRDRNLPAVLRRLTAQISDLALQFIDLPASLYIFLQVAFDQTLLQGINLLLNQSAYFVCNLVHPARSGASWAFIH